MSFVKRIYEDNRENLTQEQFNEYWTRLNEMYQDPEYMMDFNEIADIMNFEFDLNLSDVDVRKFREENKNIEEEDAKLIHKNLGL